MVEPHHPAHSWGMAMLLLLTETVMVTSVMRPRWRLPGASCAMT